MKELPTFKSVEEEQKFWSEHDSTEYLDQSKAHRGVFPNLKPSTKTISLQLPEASRSSAARTHEKIRELRHPVYFLTALIRSPVKTCRQVGTMEKIIRTICQGCHSECGVLVTVADGNVTKIGPDAEHPFSRGPRSSPLISLPVRWAPPTPSARTSTSVTRRPRSIQTAS